MSLMMVVRREMVSRDMAKTHMFYIVFVFQTVITSCGRRYELTAETDCLWKDYAIRVNAFMELDEPEPIQLAYRVAGDRGKMTNLANEVDFKNTMTHVCEKARIVHTKAVALEVKNVVSSI